MVQLHPTQKKILSVLKTHSGEGLTMRDIQNLIGVSSPGIVGHHILQLEKKGVLRRNPNNLQDYHILDEKPEEPVVYLNVYSTAQCGPNGLIAGNDPVDRMPVATRIIGFPSELAFMVQTRGNSMEPLIKEGDYAVVRKVHDRFAFQNYNNKVVVCINEDSCIIKKIHYDNKTGQVVLESFNPKYPPFIATENFWIEGEVRGVFSYS